MQLTLILPLPPKGLRPNDRSPWPVKCGLTRTAREQGRRAMFEAAKRIEAEAWIVKGYQINLYYRKKCQDQDNIAASCKAYLDGVSDSCHQDDKTFKLLGVYTEKDNENPRLEILIEVEELL